ncbi:hypothetical protein H1R20_g12108, partial [Candolleomyces eurysporus]
MDSSSRRAGAEQQRKDELERKIAALQAELSQIPTDNVALSKPESPKRRRVEPKLLAPDTPSPRKKRKTDHQPQRQQPIPQPAFKQTAQSRSQSRKSTPSLPPPPRPSNLLKNLASVQPGSSGPEPAAAVTRSTSFTDQAIVKRDENLAIIDDFEPGPYEHTPPSDDLTFDKLEPHSNIALKSRLIPHDDFKEHLSGRYFLSPSQLYSCIRLQPDKQHYDIPVPGDWVTIAVVAERGSIKYTRAPVALEPDEVQKKNKEKKKEEQKPTGKKYTNMKLIDFGARAKSSATGSKAVVRGDAFLSLLLFEADSVDLVDKGDGRKPEKVYKGGSRGAFEALEKLKEGDVIALLNPRILKPYQKTTDKPHPVDNILAVTPESASSIAIIGRARDLGMCTVKKKDGKVCGSWVDKRVSDVCEYHIQNAVQHRRAARPEFTAGTGGMSTSSIVKRKTDYDPARQWGLKPSTSGGDGATYVISGHVVRSGNKPSLFMAESMGREGQAKAKRKLDNSEVENTLKKLLERDREGMQVVLKAREAAQAKGDDPKSKGKKKATAEDDSAVAEFNKPKKAYSSSVIRSLGFDPTLKPGHRRGEITEDTQNKREKLAALCASKREIKLGPIPGSRKLSNIVAPPKASSTDASTEEHSEGRLSASPTPEDEPMIDLDDF